MNSTDHFRLAINWPISLHITREEPLIMSLYQIMWCSTKLAGSMKQALWLVSNRGEHWGQDPHSQTDVNMIGYWISTARTVLGYQQSKVPPMVTCLEAGTGSWGCLYMGSNSAVVTCAPVTERPRVQSLSRGIGLWRFISCPSTLETVSLMAHMTI